MLLLSFIVSVTKRRNSGKRFWVSFRCCVVTPFPPFRLFVAHSGKKVSQRKRQQETPKGTLQDGQPAHERGPTTQEQEHKNKAPSSQQQQETPYARWSGANKATHTAPNSPECNQIERMRPHQGKKQQVHSAPSHNRGAGQTPRRPKCYLAPGRRRQSWRYTNNRTKPTIPHGPTEPCTALRLLGHPKS